MFGNIFSALGIGIVSGAASVDSNPVGETKKRSVFGEILASLGLGVAGAAKGTIDASEVKVKDSEAGKGNTGFYVLLFAIIAVFAGTAYFITKKNK